MLAELQLVLGALQVNITMQLDKLLKLVVKMIVVLDLTSLLINLPVLCVKKDNGKIKLVNQAAKFVDQVNITMQLAKLLKLIAQIVKQEHILILL